MPEGEKEGDGKGKVNRDRRLTSHPSAHPTTPLAATPSPHRGLALVTRARLMRGNTYLLVDHFVERGRVEHAVGPVERRVVDQGEHRQLPQHRPAPRECGAPGTVPLAVGHGRENMTPSGANPPPWSACASKVPAILPRQRAQSPTTNNPPSHPATNTTT